MPVIKLRPSTAEWHDGANAQEAFYNAGKAIDLDVATPVTYAEQWEWRYSSLTDYGWLELSGFFPPLGTVNSVDLKVWIESGHIGESVPSCFGVTFAQYSLNDGASWDWLLQQIGGDVAFQELSQALSAGVDFTQIRLRTGLYHSLFEGPWTLPEHDFIRTYGVYTEVDFTPDPFPVRPDYSIPRKLVDAKVRTPLQNGNLHVRSDAAALMTLELHGEAGYGELDALLALYATVADTAFYYADEAFDPVVYRLVKFAGPPAFDEAENEGVRWRCTLREVPT
jgi:hypothetical protein